MLTPHYVLKVFGLKRTIKHIIKDMTLLRDMYEPYSDK